MLPAWLRGLFTTQGLHLISRAVFPVRDKAQQRLVTQLVTRLIPKSGSWTLLCCSHALALPSAHWEPRLCNQESAISHGRAPSAWAQKAVPSPARSAPNQGGMLAHFC